MPSESQIICNFGSEQRTLLQTKRMKNHRIITALLLFVLASSMAQAGDKIVVVVQNVREFFYSTDLPGRDNTETDRQRKMNAITNAYFPSDHSVPEADIYAFCEVECSDEMMQYIASSFAAKTGNNYQAVLDGLTYDKTINESGVTKSGFVYNADNVEPFGQNYTGAMGYTLYIERMRIQAFKSKRSGECFTLSMNHFKASSTNPIETESNLEKRRRNANSLLRSLDDTPDPDILIVGDLNSQMGEDCLTYLVDAGYEEELIKYAGPTAYTHCFDGGEIIDHVFANYTMSQQVTNVQVKAANPCSLNDERLAFSDHNFLVVTLNLEAKESPTYYFNKVNEFREGVPYLLVANDAKAANTVPVDKTYSDLFAIDVTPADGTIIMPNARNIFIFENAPGGNYYMRDYYGRYLSNGYNQTSSKYYNTANVSTKEDAHIFTVTPQANGTYKILNTTSNYYLLYHTSWGKFTWQNWATLYNGQYLPTLYEYDPDAYITGIDDVQLFNPVPATRKFLQHNRIIVITPDGTKYTLQGISIK